MKSDGIFLTFEEVDGLTLESSTDDEHWTEHGLSAQAAPVAVGELVSMIVMDRHTQVRDAFREHDGLRDSDDLVMRYAPGLCASLTTGATHLTSDWRIAYLAQSVTSESV
jgi:hypothetical protein